MNEINKNSCLIFTDGASRGNPGPGGYAAVVAYGAEVFELGGRVEKTTNNQMELEALRVALARLQHQEIKEIKNSSFKTVYVFSDSTYVIKGMKLWRKQWLRNGWKTSLGKTVLNEELWRALDQVADFLEKQGHTFVWNYVEGHAGAPCNERCDIIATQYADGKRPILFRGTSAAYTLQPWRDAQKILAGEKAPLSEQKAQDKEKKQSRSGKAYSYLSLVDGIMRRHRTWKECEMVVKGKPAKFKKALSAEDEADIIKEWAM